MGQIGYIFNLIFTFPIFNGLMLLFNLFQDFGLSIVVLTLIIKLVLFPLTIQQLKSMKANQALQPEMQKIKKQYANDQQAQMAEMQKLYKAAGFNPAAGCLPLLIQMPVLYGLYFALNNVVRSTNHNVKDINNILYPFVPHFQKFPNINLDWFAWLSFLNPIFHVNWSWTISLGATDPSHVLPIVAGLATFIQLRMSQPKPDPNAPAGGQVDPTQQSMKLMQYIMPFFTVFIGWTFPAGLALYWTVSAIFQAAQQYFVTGWGSLLIAPNVKEVTGSVAASPNANGASSRSSNGKGSVQAYKSNGRRERTVVEEVAEAADVEDGDEDVPGNDVASTGSARTLPRSSTSGPSQYTRRQRGGSASARRRGGSAQKARR